jgi:uncharacterized linocin/CFP29 family protein
MPEILQPLQQFNPEQTAAYRGWRQSFNLNQAAMASRHGFNAAGFGDGLIGNSAPVGPEAWRRIDGRSTKLQRSILAVYSRLAAASSTSVAVGDLVSYFAKISDSGEAHMSMDGRSKGLADAPIMTFAGTPVPIIDAVAELGWRQMEVLRKGSQSLDMDMISNKQRKVFEKLEDMAINGASNIVVGGSTIYGLRTFPDRSTDTHGLDLNAATGAQWVTAVGKVLLKLESDNAYGPVSIFCNLSDLNYAKRTDYTTTYSQTIFERLMAMGIVKEFIPASNIPASDLVGVADLDTGEWGSILTGMPPVTRPQARQNPEDDYKFIVMAMAAPQFRSDYSGQSRIAHVTKA